MDLIPIWLQTCVLATTLFFENPNIFPKKFTIFFETRIWGRLEYGWSVPWVQIPFKIHANRGVLDQICVVGPESGRGQSILGLLRVLRMPRHRFGTTRMPQPTFFFRPLRISLVNLNPWNPYSSSQFLLWKMLQKNPPSVGKKGHQYGGLSPVWHLV